MYSLIVIFSLFLAASCNSQQFLPGTLVKSIKSTSRLARNTDPNDPNAPNPNAICVGQYGPICQGCHTQVTCANDVINTQACASIDPTKPYCVDSACTSFTASPETCAIPFRCTSAGQFPNPDDCTKFYFCTGASQNAQLYTCPSNYVYDSLTGMCKQKKLSSDCKTISCTGLANRYQIFAADKSILAYCASTASLQETILFRCKDYEKMQYDQDTLQCKYVCTAEGRFVDRVDCTRYYECYKVGNLYQVEHMKCPNGFSYDSARRQCTVLSAGTACTPDLP